jgi:TnpA family transposase
MPGRFLTQAERERLQRFPEEISPQDMITYFALSARDMAKVRQQRSAHNRLGFALQLCALRYLGFSPDDVTTAPTNVVSYVAEQLKVSAESLTAYGNRPHTRRDHLQDSKKLCSTSDSTGQRRLTWNVLGSGLESGPWNMTSRPSSSSWRAKSCFVKELCARE